jgi:uncharacterized protein YggU (UPF0235/DUF167 family)
MPWTMRITVRAHPGASRERVAWEGETLHVWVTARAVEGAANRALVRAISRGLGVRASAVALVAGEHGRDKVVDVEGIERAGPTSGSPGRS